MRCNTDQGLDMGTLTPYREGRVRRERHAPPVNLSRYCARQLMSLRKAVHES